MSAALSLFDVNEVHATPAAPERLTPLPGPVLRALRTAHISTHDDDVAHVSFAPMAANTYRALVRVLAACGFCWDRYRKTHIGLAADVAALRTVTERSSYDDTKRRLEFFATSDEAAKMLAGILAREVWSVDGKPRILEPSAGDGALVAATRTAIPDSIVTAVELDPRRASILRARFAQDDRVEVIQGDILDLEEREFDGVIMNPPFSAALAHLQRAFALARNGAAIIGVAPIYGAKDAPIEAWLNDRDAWFDPTDAGTFVDTTVQAAYFGFRAGTSVIEELREALRSHPRLAEIHLRQLCELSRDAHDLFTAQCNDTMEEANYEARCAQILGAARAIVQDEAIEIIPAWDPRAGHGFRLALPSGETNDWGRTGMIVKCAPSRRNERQLARSA